MMVVLWTAKNGTIRYLGTVTDISGRKAAEGAVHRAAARANSSLAEKEVLLNEVHHRVKNNLQVIASMLSLGARRFKDPEVRRVLGESRLRVQSIALVHEQLYQSGDFAQIDLDAYLAALVHNVLTAQSTSRTRAHVIPHGAKLPLDRAIPCGLIVTELVTNALKHAFTDPSRAGTIRVSIDASDAP